MKTCLPSKIQEDIVDALLGEERKREGDDDGYDGTLTCRDNLTNIDWDFDVRWGGCDDGAVGATRGVGVAGQVLVDPNGWRHSEDVPGARRKMSSGAASGDGICLSINWQ